jgi:hypothetical protein
MFFTPVIVSIDDPSQDQLAFSGQSVVPEGVTKVSTFEGIYSFLCLYEVLLELYVLVDGVYYIPQCNVD